MGDYIVNNLYQGGSSFNPSVQDLPHYLGQQGLISAGQMGMTTDPRTANQLSELNHKLNQGAIPIEIGTLGMQEWDTIPTEHFNEMRRKAELAGAEVSLHAPIQGMDPAGFGEKGWEESQQRLVERQLMDVVDKAALVDKKKNMPITIHGSNYHGSTWKMVGEGEDRRKEYDTLMAVDVETGQAVPIQEDTKFYPTPVLNEKTEKIEGYIHEKKYTPEDQLDAQNRTKWDDAMQKIEFERENALGALKNLDITVQAGYLRGDIDETHSSFGDIKNRMDFAKEHLSEAERSLNSEFSRAYKVAEINNNQDQLERLKKISKNHAKRLGIQEDGKVAVEAHTPLIKSMAMGETIKELRDMTPDQFVKVEDFATKKASETFGNVAWHSYKEHGEGAPVVSIENLDQGRFGFSQGDDLAKLAKESRDKFVDAAINEKDKKKRLTKSQAEKAAEKMIGVTFDVGHLNISRKYGFKDEDLVKEAEAVKKFVKHVHLTDNFGYADTHLPIGMGNVPVKELLEALGEEGKQARKINEVGGWFQFFKDSPFPQLLQAAGSPLYSSSAGPYWTQSSGFQESYSSGGGMMLPSTHYSMFGAGFSQLPSELGGSVGGEGGRMGGGH